MVLQNTLPGLEPGQNQTPTQFSTLSQRSPSQTRLYRSRVPRWFGGFPRGCKVSHLQPQASPGLCARARRVRVRYPRYSRLRLAETFHLV